MQNIDNYRSSNDYREILRILQKATSLQENFLWQSHALGRTVIAIKHLEIDFVSREVVVYSDQRFEIDPELALYVKLDYRTSVFKITDFRRLAHAVHFSFPVEVKTLELRESPRHEVPFNVEKTICMKPSISGHRDTGDELQVRALDISKSGLGVLVSENNRAFLKNNRILCVTQLGEHTLTTPLLAEVVFMNNEVDARHQSKKNRTLKVGLKVSGIFPSDIYQLFIQ